MRIVVADDNPAALRVISDFLTFIGHEVQIASDGRDALAVVNSFRPEMAFLDIEMPVLNGYEVALQLRAGNSNPKVVLAAVTGLSGENESKAIEAGFDHFFTKPVDLTLLEEFVNSHSSSGGRAEA